MKSKVYSLPSLISKSKRFIKAVSEDKLTVHAAEASFFVITSAVPFISLLIAIIGILLPGNLPSSNISLGAAEILKFVFGEMEEAPGISLISISAMTALWSASRGVGAVRGGIETVYHAEKSKTYLARRVKSLISTVIFIALLTAVASLLLFGDLVLRFFGDESGDVIYSLRTPLFIAVAAGLFTCVYASVAQRSDRMPHSFVCHIPGALFSSVGWVLFSYFYSLYISNFPGASYIYGSLAAICLIMLWIYICMIILLLGAEVNKLIFSSKKHVKQGDA